MKSKKCALGFVAALAAITGLASCDQATEGKDGAIFTYTDANGRRTSYTTDDLLKNYSQNSSSLSTEFDKIYEALIRHYYETTGKSKLATLESEATQELLNDKLTAQTNAESNGTTYEQEFETILDSNNVDNASELWQKHLYEKEKDLFETDIYENFNLGSASGINGYEVLRDGGYYTTDGVHHSMFDFQSTDYGDVQDGWLKDQMPYEIRHILVKLNSGSNKSYTQDKITEPTATGEGGEVTKLTTVLKGLAGASTSSGSLSGLDDDERKTFDSLSSYSDDDGSKAAFGEYSKSGEGPMTKSQNSELVHEFIYGVYAYESLYNVRNNDSTKNAYGAENSYRIAPGLKQDATSQADVDTNLTILDENGNSTTVYDYFKNSGVGTIPFGAIMALADAGKIETDDSTSKGKVNEGNEAFYPRNVIYNKYFNKHNVCVITPNAIAYNAVKIYNDDGSLSDTYRATWANSETLASAQSAMDEFYDSTNHTLKGPESTDGVYTSQFGNLPGFQVNTQDILPQFTNNVLTDSDGEIVLAVRAGASSYQGIHLITVKRSALSEYGVTFDTSTKTTKENSLADVGTESNGKITYTKNSPSLSDYYSIYTPDSNNYPTYGDAKEKMSTYVNYNVHDNSEYATRAGWITSAIKSGFSDNLSSYLFQFLVESNKIEFTNKEIGESVKNYIKVKRQSTSDTAHKTWADNWKEYAEQLVAQNEERSVGYTATGANGNSKLLTEAAAIEFGNPKKQTTGYTLWQKGGACYYATTTND